MSAVAKNGSKSLTARAWGIRDMVLCALFAALVAVGTFIKIPTPLLPLTLQTLSVVLSGLVLGSRRGAVAVAVYVAAGLVGLPVFTQGGGLGYVLNPTFGYIVSFIAGAWLAGFLIEAQGGPLRADTPASTYPQGTGSPTGTAPRSLRDRVSWSSGRKPPLKPPAERQKPGLWGLTLAGVAAIALIYAIGIPYYYVVARWYLGKTLAAGVLLWTFVLMPLPGDLLSCFAAALIVQRLRAFQA